MQDRRPFEVCYLPRDSFNHCDNDPFTLLNSCTLLMLQAIVSLLLSAGSDSNVSDNLGSSALLEAVRTGHIQILEQLKAAGATLHLSSKQLHHVLCDLVLESKQELLRSYLAAGADVDVADHNKQTALHVAAYTGNLSMVSSLLGDCDWDMYHTTLACMCFVTVIPCDKLSRV